VPFLDHHFVELGVGVPSRLKLAGGEPKAILKKALEPILPRTTLYRSKQGFVVPVEDWIARAILPYIERHKDAFCRDTGLFDPVGVQALVDQARNGSSGAVFSLWNIYFLMIWFDRWLR
jgi:asparagine synthase (glutamine-hydrolysing)